MTPVTVLVNAEDKELCGIIGDVVKTARANLYSSDASQLSLVGIHVWDPNVREQSFLKKTCIIYSSETPFYF